MRHHSVSRREFMACATAGSILAAGAVKQSLAAEQAPAPPGTAGNNAGLTTYQLGPQIWVRWDNRLVTCYRAHRSQKYPYLYPLAGPVSGLSVTSETSLPYPHHRSLFFGCDRVNEGNYWQEDYDRGQILSNGPLPGGTTEKSVEIRDACDWQKPGGPVVMHDQRLIAVTIAGPTLRFIDVKIDWQAVQDVTIAKTNHSLFAMRAAGDLTPVGGGRLVNAEGLSGEKATFGKPSGWCDFSGRRAGLPGDIVEGIALFDHPKNPWAPTPWFTRDYGFASPSPLNFQEKPWQLAAGKSVSLRYRVVIHAGDAEAAGLADLYKAWTVL